MHRIEGIGETQSTNAQTDINKTATLAQARIYRVGELAKVEHSSTAVIVLYKDKTAQAAVVSKHTPTTSVEEGSMGEVSYKFVQRVDPMSLKKDKDLQDFARILVSTIKWVSGT